MRSVRGTCILTLLFAGFVSGLSAQQTDLLIRNGTGATVYFLYVSPTSADSWGDDMLGATVLASGDTFRVRMRTAAEAYDVRVVDSNDNEYIIWGWRPGPDRRVTIEQRHFVGLSGLVDSDVTGWLSIVNSTNYSIREVYVAAAGSLDWSEENQHLAAGQMIHDGEDYAFEVDVDRLGTTIVDILLVDEDGDRYLKWDINLEFVVEIEYTLDDLFLR